MPLRIIEPIGVVACGEDCQIIYGQASGLAFRFDELTQDPARLEWWRLLLRPGLGQAFGAVLYRAVDTLTLAADEADDAPEPPEDTIEPEITASAPDALFSTDDDWVTATQRLIARKRLTGDDEDGAALP